MSADEQVASTVSVEVRGEAPVRPRGLRQPGRTGHVADAESAGSDRGGQAPRPGAPRDGSGHGDVGRLQAQVLRGGAAPLAHIADPVA